MSSARARDSGHKLKHRRFCLNFLQWGWLSTRTGCPDRWWNIHPWRCGPGKPALGDLLEQGSWTRWPSNLKHSEILFFSGLCPVVSGKFPRMETAQHPWANPFQCLTAITVEMLFFISSLNHLFQFIPITSHCLPYITMRSPTPSSWWWRELPHWNWGLMVGPPEAISFSRLNKPSSISLSSWGKYFSSPPSWWSSSNCLPFSDIFLELGDFKLDTVFQMWPYMCWVEEANYFPVSTESTPVHTALDAVSILCSQGKSLFSLVRVTEIFSPSLFFYLYKPFWGQLLTYLAQFSCSSQKYFTGCEILKGRSSNERIFSLLEYCCEP